MATLSTIPNDALILVLQFIGQPVEFLHMLTVCKAWYDKFDSKDTHLWLIISKVYDVTIHSFPALGSAISSRSSTSRSLRSTNDYKRLFIKHYFRKLANVDERHYQLLVQAKAMLNSTRDQPRKLERLIHSAFVSIDDFDVDYRCPMMESNSLLTLACRYQQNRCVRLLIDSYRAVVDIADMGGFTPLILAAYQGCFSNVVYLLCRGADWRLRGRLRSGPLLTAEHWAAIKGHLEILRYLHVIRARYPHRRLKTIPSIKETPGASVSTPSKLNQESSLSTNSYALPSISFDLGIQDKAVRTSVDFNVPMHRIDGDDGTVLISNDLSPTSSSSLDATGNSNTSFCLCGEGFTDNMVACDGFNCPVEWFHYHCVGLLCKPCSQWYCPSCFLSNGYGGAPSSAEEEGYCICGRGFEGSMVACDGRDCLIEWFHFECVGLFEEPNNRWLCPSCLGIAFPNPTDVKSSSIDIQKSKSGRQRGSKRRIDQTS